ncbi:MAG: translation initiation factor IF-2, partial [Bacteroidaceae bacterium]|nr:translation initiation factor IF-2 [Bacteroidaceae bacterium]
MAIRLGKVARNLNVGISTISEFLQKKGFALDDVSPNVKITQEQYEVLVKEFSSDKSLKIEADKFIKERHSNKEKQRAKAAEERVKEIETVLPEESRPKFKQVGKIDLDSIGKKHKVAPAKADKIETPVEVKKVEVVSDVSPKEKPVAKKKEEKTVKVKQLPTVEKTEEVDKKMSAPTVVKQPVKKNDVVVETTKNVIKENSVEKPKEKNITVTKAKKDTVLRTEEKTAVKEKDKPTLTETNSAKVFKLHSDEPQSQIKVLGKIDLSSINQSTRPKKKTKEEKRKEREDKNKVRTDQKKLRDTSKTTTTASSAASEEAKKRKKRARINKEKVNVTANSNTHAHPRTHTGPNSSNNSSNTAGGQRKPYSNTTRPGQRSGGGYRKPLHPVHVKAEVSDEDVAKQVKETLARLTSKGKKTTARYRKEKRNSAHNRQQALDDKEMAQSKTLQLTEFVTANELASMMDVSVNEVIATCMSIGIIVSINQRLDAETINLVAEEFSYKTEYVSADVSESIEIEEDAAEDLVHRAPIVTVMGHVDHGKTSLLDYIRKENVIAGEAGGITQHIGAYNVRLSDGRRITFLDTPGHEAFTAMRARGAKVTDIAIIIVAADDDIKPQTKEAINHATAAGVPIIFAINKVDKPAANPEKIKEELAAMNFLVEDWGGKYQSQDISAKKGDGVRELLDKISLEAEMLELKANPNRRAMGSIIESTLDKGRGYVATVLVSNGTLKAGDIVLAGTNYGRIKAMFNERNKRIKAAGPSEPVLILGLNGAPTAGDSFHVIETEQEAREVATKREQLQREQG